MKINKLNIRCCRPADLQGRRVPHWFLPFTKSHVLSKNTLMLSCSVGRWRPCQKLQDGHSHTIRQSLNCFSASAPKTYVSINRRHAVTTGWSAHSLDPPRDPCALLLSVCSSRFFIFYLNFFISSHFISSHSTFSLCFTFFIASKACCPDTLLYFICSLSQAYRQKI